MRRLKFRAWDKEKEEMFYPDEKFDETMVLQLNGTVGLFNGKAYNTVTERFIIDRFIGLTDFGDKEAYIGDIVEFTYAPTTLRKEVVGVIVLNQWKNNSIYADGSFYHIDNLKRGFIIGNIHENPDKIIERDAIRAYIEGSDYPIMVMPQKTIL